MAKDKIITAIDVGSSKVTTVIATYLKDEKLSVIGVSNVLSRGIRKGQVVDIEEAVASISESVDAAERMAGVSIGTAFVSIGGSHITSQNSKGIVAVSQPEGEITAPDVERVIEAAEAISLPSSREILHVLPRDFTVDGQAGIKDPLGMTGVRLEVDTQIVTGATTSVRNLAKCVAEVGIDVERVVFSGLASSEAVLSSTEKELGVVLVDIGAGTTDVAIWVDGALSYSSVLPMGARNVTNDIAVGLRVSLESAEKIKLLLGQIPKALPVVASEGEVKSHKLPDELDLSALNLPEDLKKISRKTLMDGIIKDRLLEMFVYVGQEIQKSGFGGMTPSGVVITGGGALTAGIIEACRQRLAMPCRVGSAIGQTELYGQTSPLSGLTDEITGPQFSTVIGLIQFGLQRPINLRTKRGSGQSQFSLPNLGGFGKMAEKLPLGNATAKIAKLLKSFLP